jgi:hypothetical protein
MHPYQVLEVHGHVQLVRPGTRCVVLDDSYLPYSGTDIDHFLIMAVRSGFGENFSVRSTEK